MNKLISSAIIIALAAASSVAEAQKMGQYVAQTKKAAENTVKQIWSDYYKVLPDVGNVNLNDIRVSIDIDDWTINAVRSRKSGANYSILLPIGFVMASDFMDRAYLEHILMQNSNQIPDTSDLLRYVSYVREGMAASTASQLRNEQSKPLSYYCEWSGNTKETCKSVRESQNYAAYYPLIKTGALAFILGHELGHIASDDFANDHKGGDVAVEQTADKFGLRLALESGYNPILASGTMLFFFVTHQPKFSRLNPICRMAEALKVAVRGMETDSDYIEYLRRRGTLSSLRNMQEAVAKMKREQLCN